MGMTNESPIFTPNPEREQPKPYISKEDLIEAFAHFNEFEDDFSERVRAAKPLDEVDTINFLSERLGLLMGLLGVTVMYLTEQEVPPWE